MTLQQALRAFWSQFTLDGKAIPAFVRGNGQTDGNGDAFPCITFTFAFGHGLTTQNLLAFVWLQQEDGISVNAQREALFREIAAAIPVEGKRLQYDKGFVMLYPSDELCMVWDSGETVNGKTIYGGRISYEMRQYGL